MIYESREITFGVYRFQFWLDKTDLVRGHRIGRRQLGEFLDLRPSQCGGREDDNRTHPPKPPIWELDTGEHQGERQHVSGHGCNDPIPRSSVQVSRLAHLTTSLSIHAGGRIRFFYL